MSGLSLLPNLLNKQVCLLGKPLGTYTYHVCMCALSLASTKNKKIENVFHVKEFQSVWSALSVHC